MMPNNSRTVNEISNGVAVYQVLSQIAPEHFTRLEKKIKTDVNSNWRLKVSNLKKIAESVVEYYQDVLNLQIMDVGRPDVSKIGENSDLIQLGKLLRLVVGNHTKIKNTIVLNIILQVVRLIVIKNKNT